MSSSRRGAGLAALLVFGMVLPFLGKPVHVDDANFLALARAADLWRPHDTLINWQGTTQRAFDVLSNPPGIAWWLAPVAHAPVWVMHLWMLPWLAVALWGAWALGDRLAGRGPAAMILLVGSPIAVLAAQGFTPDLPLLACVLAGMGLVISGSAWGALLVGLAALFRYSGVALIPLVALWPLLQGRPRRAAWLGALASLPLGALMLHDLIAYGQLHVLAMVGFQGAERAPVLPRLIAALAMLGGAAVLPVLAWVRPRAATLGGLAGVALGLIAGHLSDQSGAALAATLLATTAGGITLAAALRGAGPHRLWLRAWLLLGLVFFVALRFMAARYWLPFFAPAALLLLPGAGRRLLATALVLTPALSLLLAIDDLHLALAQRDLARRVEALGTGVFAGHWGWQWQLERAGWRPLEEDAPVPPGTLFAVSQAAWPQAPAPGCLVPVTRLVAPDHWPGPRVHTASGAANIHANVVSALPPVQTYAPWTFADDPLDTVTVWRGCP